VVALLTPAAADAGPTGTGGEGGATPEGTLSGTITDPEGDPVADAWVSAGSSNFVVEVGTDEDGTYSISLPPGYYAVEVVPDGTALAGEYYDDSYTSHTPVQVISDQETAGIDIQLAVGATIAGTIVDGEGDPVADAEVFASSWWDSWPGYGTWTTTDENGAYELVGLPPGYAVLSAYPPEDRPDLGFEFYDNAFSRTRATPVLLALGEAESGIDFELGPPGSISGTVTTPTGAPAANVEVWALPPDWFDEPITTRTAADGTYTISVAPGEYRVRFRPPAASGWLEEWYDDVHSSGFEAGDLVEVADAQAVVGIDAQFDEGGSVSGRVTGLSGRGAGGVTVVLTSTADPTDQLVATTSAAGTWSLPAAPVGDYTVEFVSSHGREWYDDQLRPGTATPITIATGTATTGIDGSLSHIVWGQDWDNGTRVLAQCQSGDVSAFTFTVDGFDPTGGVTQGTIDFGDGTTPFVFDSSGDSVTHTYTWTGGDATGPASEVTVTLTGGGAPSDSFTILPGATPCHGGDAPTFSDVPATHQFSEAIECLVDLEVTNGFEDGTFRPGLTITRAAVVSWLWRLAGEPPADALPEYDDVPESHPFADAIAWATEWNIVGGYPDGTFRPGAPITRGAVAAWMHRFVGEPEADLPTGFSDVPDSHLFAEAIAWLKDAGVTQGYPDGTFRPGQQITRGGLAVWMCGLSGIDPWSGETEG
jgi:hypothetical protein